MEKRILKNKWLVMGRKAGIGMGFDFSNHFIQFDLLFWYVVVEL